MTREPVMTEWAGLPNYGCPICDFATPDEDKFATHMQFIHPEDERSPLLVERREREKAAREAKAAESAEPVSPPIEPVEPTGTSAKKKG